MNKIIKSSVLILFLFPFLSLHAKKNTDPKDWKLAVHAYSFKEYSFIEAVEKARSLGVKYIEVYRNQLLGKGFEEGAQMNFLEMNDTTIKKIKKLLKENGLKAIAIGVFTPVGKEEWIKTFEVAGKLGIEIINSEPLPSEIPMIDQLASKYKIKVALHNHAKKSAFFTQETPYWNPQVAFDAIQGCGPYIGICGDIKHWLRSDLDPLECIKLLEGRFFSFHFSDVHAKAPDAHDVPWGTGVANIKNIIEALHRGKFEGVISIEYSYNWTNSVPEIKESIDYYEKIIHAVQKKNR